MISRPSSPVRMASSLGLAAVALLAGCRVTMVDLDPREDTTRRFELRAAAGRPAAAAAVASDRVLLVETFAGNPKYDERFVRLVGGTEIAASEANRWVQPPAVLFTAALHDACLASGLFRHVATPGSPARADLRVSGTVLTFEQRPGPGSQTVAALRVAVAVTREAAKPGDPRSAPGQIVWEKVLETTEPVTAGQDPAQAFADAMSRAVSRALTDVLNGLATLTP